MGNVGEPQEVCALVGSMDVTVPGKGSGSLGDERRKEVLAQSRHDLSKAQPHWAQTF